MTQVGNVYGEALYDLARSEDLDSQVLAEISALNESFCQEPDFLRLLAAPNVPKEDQGMVNQQPLTMMRICLAIL